MGYMCNKSSPNRMRFSGLTGGNSTKSFVSQLPPLDLNWVGDSLLEGSAYSMGARPSGKIAAVEREGCNSQLRLKASPQRRVYSAGVVEGTPSVHKYLNEICNVQLAQGEIDGVSPDAFNCGHPGGPIASPPRSQMLRGPQLTISIPARGSVPLIESCTLPLRTIK